MNAQRPPEPVEPELELRDIQGIAVPGFLKPAQTLICVRHGHDAATIAKLKAFLHRIAPYVTNGVAALSDRFAHRESVDPATSAPRNAPAPAPAGERAPLLAIAFAYPCLLRLTSRAASLHGEAFKLGLAARSALLGDPATPGIPGHPSTWKIGGPGKEVDFMIVVAGDGRRRVDICVQVLERKLAAFGTVRLQRGDRLSRSDHKGRVDGFEHFGFADGISQPGIRGRTPDAPYPYLTDRTDDPTRSPALSLHGLPGQDLVWPGEFVIGYPKSGPDPLWPGPVDLRQPAWAKNGSFLVYRRLRQDVSRFWRSMDIRAVALSKQPGFGTLTSESLAASLVGRWPSGAPLSRLPVFENVDDPKLGSDRDANNDFLFDSETPSRTSRSGREYPAVPADPLGLRCPLASHIRKVNPRDAAADVDGTSATCTRRILRIGVPYGPRSRSLRTESTVDRGLLFLCIQASIEDQFEFLQARWMNDERRPGGTPGGHDMIAGRNPAGRVEGRRPLIADAAPPTENDESSEHRRCTLIGAGGQEAIVDLAHPAVTPTGGGYFFVPPLSAIGGILAK